MFIEYCWVKMCVLSFVGYVCNCACGMCVCDRVKGTTFTSYYYSADISRFNQ